ncbi:MAG: cytochrome c [Mariprofundaceae bacterium]|nr:cytochrome c [Mariprofundaceae bacterium]
MKKTFAIMIAAACLGLGSQAAIAGPDGAKIFKKKCAMCHKIDKKKVGPAVKDMNKDNAVLKATITNGRKMMPKFSKKLDAAEIDAVVAFLAENRG